MNKVLESTSRTITILTILIMSSCAKETTDIVTTSWQSCPGIEEIEYEGKSYSTVLIGEQCWTKENLNVGNLVTGSSDQYDNNLIEKYCYDDLPANCDVYGALYQWTEAMQYSTNEGNRGICPPGWHIPTDEEWIVLEGFVDSKYEATDTIWIEFAIRGFDAGENLKGVGQNKWDSPYSGNDDRFGFTILAGGERHDNGDFGGIGFLTSIWSSSNENPSLPIRRRFFSDFMGSQKSSHPWSYAAYIRCIHD